MSRQGRSVFTLLVVFVTLATAATASADDESGVDEAQEKVLAERFRTVLEKNPRRGTAFDKVYSYHLERGSLDDLLKLYRQKVETAPVPEAASASIIVGLIESQRGREAEAIAALTKADDLDRENWMASFLLAQSLVAAGQIDPAASAFERAILRKPSPTDLLDVYQSLGRAYQRAQRPDLALDVWNRLEKLFPNDVRVQEQIATTLLEENDLNGALPRLENLARISKDRVRRSQFQIEAAEIKARLGKTDEAILDYETLLQELNPDSWLYRDARQRVESVYLRKDDQAGLVDYYTKWLQKNPEDLDAMARQARLLAGLNRRNDAQTWLRRGLEKAPTNATLRHALIDILLSDHRFSEATEQYRELDKHQPNNPDTLRDWGRTILKDMWLDEPARKRGAGDIWRKLLTARPKDAHTALMVADLFRRAEMTDDAIEHYRRAIDLDPDAVQYREYLGEYLHTLNRVEEAVATWRDIATGSRETAPNLSRLSDILAQFSHLPEAIETNAKACRLDPRDFNLQLKRANLLSQSDRHDAALTHLTDIEKLIATVEEREAWLQKQLQTLKSLKRLGARIDEARKEMDDRSRGVGPKDADRWYWLSRAHEADGKPRLAITAIARAIELDPNSVPILTVSARLNESQNQLRTAVEIYTRLANSHRRNRSEYLKRVAILEEKIGHRDQALQAGRDMLAAAPGNPELCDFFAQMCLRLRRSDEAIQVLRRSLRMNPGDVLLLTKLATTLADTNQTLEAIELFWRAFERSHHQDERLSIVTHLAQAYSKQRQSSQLFVRLERESRDHARHREMTFCLAQAYDASGDVATAERTLQELLGENPRDLEALTQLRGIAERRKDLTAAIRYQREVFRQTASSSDRMHLASLLFDADLNDEAADLIGGEFSTTEVTASLLKFLDNLCAHGRHDAAFARLERCLKQFPDN